MLDVSHAIVPKSDQINADDLWIKNLTIEITKVEVKKTDQPVVISYKNDQGKPYKPCKSMLRVLSFLWGVDGNNYVGKSLTLYRDPTVKWSGADVGGIRISHMSAIDQDYIKIPLTISRGKKILYEVKRLNVLTEKDLSEFLEKLKACSTMEAIKQLADDIKAKSYLENDYKKSLMENYKTKLGELSK